MDVVLLVPRFSLSLAYPPTPHPPPPSFPFESGFQFKACLKVTSRSHFDQSQDCKFAVIIEALLSRNFSRMSFLYLAEASVTYSEDRMEEASVLRERFERVLALADSMIGADCGSTRKPARRWGDREKRLVEKTMTCRR